MATELSLFLADDIEFKPDLHVFSAALKSHNVRGPDVLVAIEIAASSQRRDFDLKSPLYAAHGVRELWVLDLDARTATIFRDPGQDRYASREERPPEAPLSSTALPGVTIRLADLF